MKVRAGEFLRTGAASRLTLRASQVGRIDIGPESELSASTDRRVRLRRGQLHAYIWAPPRQFVVDTPSARAVDLGCEYTLDVDASGNGRLRVSMGWVAFQDGGRGSFIPAGAECVTRKMSGPGIPYYQDAPEELKNALAAFELGDTAALGRILRSARERDALTLWHLLTRAPAPGRGPVFDRFAQLVALPKGVTREGVLRGDENDINLCWDALNLRNAQWWRGWERKWR
ncbi:MAG TPA: FecR domain-containing protein [Bryobacteraceae bacterium]|nr:FecR domain-containing protein [Bryobacteraceae bacterium]